MRKRQCYNDDYRQHQFRHCLPQSTTTRTFVASFSSLGNNNNDDDDDDDERIPSLSTSTAAEISSSDEDGLVSNISRSSNNKDKLIRSYLQDLPKIREEIFAILEDEEQQQQQQRERLCRLGEEQETYDEDDIRTMVDDNDDDEDDEQEHNQDGPLLLGGNIGGGTQQQRQGRASLRMLFDVAWKQHCAHDNIQQQKRREAQQGRLFSKQNDGGESGNYWASSLDDSFIKGWDFATSKTSEKSFRATTSDDDDDDDDEFGGLPPSQLKDPSLKSSSLGVVATTGFNGDMENGEWTERMGEEEEVKSENTPHAIIIHHSTQLSDDVGVVERELRLEEVELDNSKENNGHVDRLEQANNSNTLETTESLLVDDESPVSGFASRSDNGGDAAPWYAQFRKGHNKTASVPTARAGNDLTNVDDDDNHSDSSQCRIDGTFSNDDAWKDSAGFSERLRMHSVIGSGSTVIDDIPSEVREELEKVCVLLETMSPRDWQIFDKEESLETAVGDDEEESLETAIEEELESVEGDSIQCFREGDKNDIEDFATAIDKDAPLTTSFEAALTELDKVHEVLEHARSVPLSTYEYNLLLARVATSPELSTEEIMGTLLDIYQHMTKFGAPDDTTYRILLTTLERRISGGDCANDSTITTLLQHMMNFKLKLTSPILLELAMRCLDRGNRLDVAKQFVMDHTLDDKERTFQVPNGVMRSLMKMIARENEQESAIRLLRKCIKEHGRRGSRDTDSVVGAAVGWPDRNRAGQQRDITQVLEAILQVIVSDSNEYRPGFRVWRNLIVALSRTAQADSSRWELLRRPFRALFDQYEQFYPDELLLRVGLDYCEATKDSKLARALIERSVELHAPKEEGGYSHETSSSGFSTDSSTTSRFVEDSYWTLEEVNSEKSIDAPIMSDANSTEAAGEMMQSGLSFVPEETPDALEGTHSERSLADASNNESSIDGQVADAGSSLMLDDTTQATYQAIAPFSIKFFQKAINVCLAAEDVESGQYVLDALSKMGDVYSKDIQSATWALALKGFASLSNQDANSVERIFETMKSKGMKISEESYGAIMHIYAIGNRPEQTSELFQELKSGSDGDGVSPGLSCYNALMLSCLNKRAWKEALQAYNDMKRAGLVPNPTTTQGILIASYRNGGKEQVRQTMQELLAMNLAISRENCQLVLKILMPDIVKGRKKQVSIEDIQQRLRQLGSEKDSLRPVCLDLLRSLRQADIEEKRLPTKNAPLEILAKRREVAWRSALKDVLRMDKARESVKNDGKKRELSAG